MPLTYEYIIRDEGREGVRYNEYMRLQALHTNYFRSQSGGYHYFGMTPIPASINTVGLEL
jgi:hypothetical protein